MSDLPSILLSGLDTVECAYYLRPTASACLDFEALRLKRETHFQCWRQFKIDHLCQLNFDQGSKAGFVVPGCG